MELWRQWFYCTIGPDTANRLADLTHALAADVETLLNANAEVASLRSALQEARDERDGLKESLGMLDEEVMDFSTQLVAVDGDTRYESVSKHLAAILAELQQLRAVQRGERDT